MSTASSRLSIRTMTRVDLDRALDWAAAESWNPGLHDAVCFHESDPKGFFIGEIDGEPVGCIAAVSYGSSFGWIGMYIVRPGFRGLGYGLEIWKAGMAYLGSRVVGLDGVEAQQENYAKWGFRTSHRDIRFEGMGGGTATSGVVDLAQLPFEQVLAYDRAFFPVSRPEFWKCWIKAPGGKAYGIVQNNKLHGLGVMRACRNGYRVGPLYAEDEQIAEDLFKALTSRADGASVFLDVPEVNTKAIDLVRRRHMREVFATARMYKGASLSRGIDKVFSVTSLELG